MSETLLPPFVGAKCEGLRELDVRMMIIAGVQGRQVDLLIVEEMELVRHERLSLRGQEFRAKDDMHGSGSGAERSTTTQSSPGSSRTPMKILSILMHCC